MNNTLDKPNATNKFSRLFPGVDFAEVRFCRLNRNWKTSNGRHAYFCNHPTSLYLSMQRKI
jgi:hypothetical protein